MTNAIKLNVGTTIQWKDSGGDYVLTADDLAAVTGRIGARGDLGAWPRAKWWRWYMEAGWASNPTADQTLELWYAGWDNDTGPASPHAQVSSSDSALTVAQLKNMTYVGSVIVQAASTAAMSGGGTCFIPYRYISPAIYNTSSTKALADVAAVPFLLRLTPIFDEVQ